MPLLLHWPPAPVNSLSAHESICTSNLPPRHLLLLQRRSATALPHAANVASLPALNDQQALKLKQLTVVSLASNRQVRC